MNILKFHKIRFLKKLSKWENIFDGGGDGHIKNHHIIIRANRFENLPRINSLKCVVALKYVMRILFMFLKL